MNWTGIAALMVTPGPGLGITIGLSAAVLLVIIGSLAAKD